MKRFKCKYCWRKYAGLGKCFEKHHVKHHNDQSMLAAKRLEESNEKDNTDRQR